jgi:phosphoribosylglycinamide formyltransferase-1
MINLAVFASGNGSNFEHLVKGAINYRVNCLIVDREDAYAIKRAEKLNIRVYLFLRKDYFSKKDFEDNILRVLKTEKIDLIALAGYMRILGKTLISAYPKKIINIHPSLLPHFPGKQAIVDAYNQKANKTGVTIFYIDEGIDTGEIITQKEIDIQAYWSIDDLEQAIHKVEHELFCKTINDLIGAEYEKKSID